MTVPHITIEQMEFIALPWIDINATVAKINKRIDIANAEQEQPLITAEEARKLGAGNFEALCHDGKWRVGTKDCPCREFEMFGGYKTKVKYRATKPEPVQPHAELKAMYEQQVKDGTLGDFVWEYSYPDEPNHRNFIEFPSFTSSHVYYCTPKPTCQVQFINGFQSGEVITMTREAAKKLQAENKTVCDWFTPLGSQLEPDDDSFAFKSNGIYTYKLKANLVKLDGELMARDVAWRKIALSNKDLYALWDNKWIFSEAKNCGELNNHNFLACEYQLREKGTVKLTIDDEPAKMLTPAQCEAERLARIDTHDLQCRYGNAHWIQLANTANEISLTNDCGHEYRLIRKQPKPWTGSREDVIALLKELGFLDEGDLV